MPATPIKKNKHYINDDSGFTLLEIIAVIVILSILGVVALPKYFNLQEQAKDKAMGAGISEAMGRVNGYFAQEVLSGANPDDIDYPGELSPGGAPGDMGDFWLTVTVGNFELDEEGDVASLAVADGDVPPTILLHIVGKDDTPIAGETKDKIVPRPGL